MTKDHEEFLKRHIGSIAAVVAAAFIIGDRFAPAGSIPVISQEFGAFKTEIRERLDKSDELRRMETALLRAEIGEEVANRKALEAKNTESFRVQTQRMFDLKDQLIEISRNMPKRGGFLKTTREEQLAETCYAEPDPVKRLAKRRYSPNT